jgi:hypothetical protein
MQEILAQVWRLQSAELTNQRGAFKFNSLPPGEGLRAMALATAENAAKSAPEAAIAFNAMNRTDAARALVLAMREEMAQWL